MLGFVVAAAGMRALVGRPRSLAAGVPFAAAVLVTLLAVPAVWGGMRGLDSVRDGLALAPGISEREKCMLDGGHTSLIEPSRRLIGAMPAGSRFAVSGPGVDVVCLQLALLPRLMVDAKEPRDYTLHYDDIPADVRARLKDGDSSVERIDADFVLVKER